MILVFGKTGQVATELQRQAEVTALGRDRADLSDPQACAAIIADLKPSVVINAAAYTAVDTRRRGRGSSPDHQRRRPRCDGGGLRASGYPVPACLDRLRLRRNGHPRMARNRPCRTAKRLWPHQAGRRSRRCAASGARHIILRTAWVFSAHGDELRQDHAAAVRDRDALSVVDDQIGGPTPAADIAATLLTLADALQEWCQRRHLSLCRDAPHTSWAGFASDDLRTGGPRCDRDRHPVRRLSDPGDTPAQFPA